MLIVFSLGATKKVSGDRALLRLGGLPRTLASAGARLRDRLLTSTDRLGRLATIPVVVQVVNKVNTMPVARKAMDKVLGVAARPQLPPYDAGRFRKTMRPSVSWAMP